MPRKVEQSRKLQKRAEMMIPGGVNSPVRAFRAVGGDPPFVVRGKASHIFDADGNEYIDYIGSWGPLILGHAAPGVIHALGAALRKPTSPNSCSRRSRICRKSASSVPGRKRPCPQFDWPAPAPSASTS